MGVIAGQIAEAGAATFDTAVTWYTGMKQLEATKKAQEEAREMYRESFDWDKQKFSSTLGLRQEEGEEASKQYWASYRQEMRRYKENVKRARIQNLENRFNQWASKNQTNTQAAIELSRMS